MQQKRKIIQLRCGSSTTRQRYKIIDDVRRCNRTNNWKKYIRIKYFEPSNWSDRDEKACNNLWFIFFGFFSTLFMLCYHVGHQRERKKKISEVKNKIRSEKGRKKMKQNPDKCVLLSQPTPETNWCYWYALRLLFRCACVCKSVCLLVMKGSLFFKF